jgi:uncharacterized coiled-coil protein SlyX
MRKDIKLISELALFMAGALVAGYVRSSKRPTHELPALRAALAEMERRVAEEASSTARRFAELDARLAEQSAKLSEIPDMKQIASAVEHAVARAMRPVEERLTAQGQAIDGLKSGISQSDTLLERILDVAKETRANRGTV